MQHASIAYAEATQFTVPDSENRTASPSVKNPANALHHAVQDLCTGYSAETTPGASQRVADYRVHLTEGTRVYVTFLPGTDFADTCVTATRLASEGFSPVPHIAARSISDASAFALQLQRLHETTGVDEALLIAGGVSTPAGPFADSMQLANSGVLQDCGFTRFGFAGHPEGSPDVSEFSIAKAVADKNEFASRTGARCHLVTQFCFEAEPVLAWERMLRAQGNRLPIHIGLPGLATLKTLISHARACGVGPSMRFLTRQARQVTKLLKVSAPEAQLLALAHGRLSDPACSVEALHVFPLGGLTRSAAWMNAIVAGDFTIADGILNVHTV